MTITRTASLLTLLLAALPAWAVEPFTAEYEASWKGVQAEARMTLSPAGDNRWRYELDIANQLGSARQATVFEDHDGTWRLLSGDDVTQLLVRKSQKTATYDWGSNEVRWSGDVKADRRGPVELRDGDVDAMLLNLAIVRDVAAGRPLDYRVVENGVARRQSWKILGKDTVTIAGKPHAATRVGRSSDDKEVLVWVVKGLPVPARILQRRDGKDEQDLVLKSAH